MNPPGGDPRFPEFPVIMATYALPSAPDTQPGPSSRLYQARPSGLSIPPNATTTFVVPTQPAGELQAAYMRKMPTTPSTADATRANASGAEISLDDSKKKKAKRRKVNHACLYCRRSHMTCDEGRPCQRWCALLTPVLDPALLSLLP